MKRRIYISEGNLSLAEFMPQDAAADYQDWQDKETQRGYNTDMTCSFADFQARPHRHRLYAVIICRDAPETPLGIVMISPPPGVPDLAIRVFASCRGRGLGPAAFSLAVRYAFGTLKVAELHAGVYAGNLKSQRMLERCGFVRYPAGDLKEIQYETGDPIWQYDYIYGGAS